MDDIIGLGSRSEGEVVEMVGVLDYLLSKVDVSQAMYNDLIIVEDLFLAHISHPGWSVGVSASR